MLLASSATSAALPLLPDTVDGYPPGMADAVVSRWDVHASDELAGYDEFRAEPLRWDRDLGNPLRSTSTAVTAWLARDYR